MFSKNAQLSIRRDCARILRQAQDERIKKIFISNPQTTYFYKHYPAQEKTPKISATRLNRKYNNTNNFKGHTKLTYVIFFRTARPEPVEG